MCPSTCVKYAGFPILGIEWQKMENPDLRKALGMKSIQKGVRIRRVEPTAPASKSLQASDILLSFDDIDIANDGTGTYFLPTLTLSCIFETDEVKLNIRYCDKFDAYFL